MKDRWNNLFDKAGLMSGYLLGAFLMLEPLEYMSLGLRRITAPLWIPVCLYLIYKAFKVLRTINPKEEDQ